MIFVEEEKPQMSRDVTQYKRKIEKHYRQQSQEVETVFKQKIKNLELDFASQEKNLEDKIEKLAVSLSTVTAKITRQKTQELEEELIKRQNQMDTDLSEVGQKPRPFFKSVAKYQKISRKLF